MNRTLRGTVVHGQGLGHRFGFPTANLKVEAGTALYEALERRWLGDAASEQKPH